MAPVCIHATIAKLAHVAHLHTRSHHAILAGPTLLPVQTRLRWHHQAFRAIETVTRNQHRSVANTDYCIRTYRGTCYSWSHQLLETKLWRAHPNTPNICISSVDRAGSGHFHPTAASALRHTYTCHDYLCVSLYRPFLHFYKNKSHQLPLHRYRHIGYTAFNS